MEAATTCVCDIRRYINGTRLDDRIIRTDWDAGFVEGRQYGRGKGGGQVGYYFIIVAINFLLFVSYCLFGFFYFNNFMYLFVGNF